MVATDCGSKLEFTVWVVLSAVMVSAVADCKQAGPGDELAWTSLVAETLLEAVAADMDERRVV